LARADKDSDLTIYPGDYKVELDTNRNITFEFRLVEKQAVIETLPPLAASYNFTVPVHIQAPSTKAHS
jgi:beta-D-xylosidase 4